MQGKTKLLVHAKRMRHVPTEAESLLWRQLRAGRLADYKFKRQQPIGNFIVDFVCFAQKLVVEVDGGQHTDLKIRDEARTAWLQAQGFRVLRFWNHDVLQRLELVLEEILHQLEAQETR
jgi:very-short-patch-repair endonuclease